jgi:hypothetical protein
MGVANVGSAWPLTAWTELTQVPLMDKEKVTRSNASQFFVAGDLCRRGYSAVVTLGNTPNTDVLCSNLARTRFVHIQVKTFVPGNRTCSVGLKAEKYFGPKNTQTILTMPSI